MTTWNKEKEKEELQNKFTTYTAYKFRSCPFYLIIIPHGNPQYLKV